MERNSKVNPWAAMNFRRWLILLSLSGVMAAVVLAIAEPWWHATPPRATDWSKFIGALRHYSQRRIAEGRPVPTSVSLGQLISDGLLKREDARAFDGMEVAFNLKADGRNPQAILAVARMPDGAQLVLHADGSAEQVPKDWAPTNR